MPDINIRTCTIDDYEIPVGGVKLPLPRLPDIKRN